MDPILPIVRFKFPFSLYVTGKSFGNGPKMDYHPQWD